jgi:hypothetical protein
VTPGRVHLVSFATPDFQPSFAELAASARRFGVDEVHEWGPERLRRTDFYRAHHAVLDRPRGAGYWLWKPYILKCLLDQARDGEVVLYADAAITVLRPLAPLAELCRERGGILVFRGHYDGLAGRPNVCRVWTKRDAFVLTGTDEPAFHDAPMLDAAFLALARTQRARRFVDEWLRWCTLPAVLTDDPNSCGRANLPGFVEHRHDQSILSLLAARHGLEVFRAPSQFGNHCKAPALREAGEWLRQPYDDARACLNSPYPTLLFHHRKRRLDPSAAPPARFLDLDSAGLPSSLWPGAERTVVPGGVAALRADPRLAAKLAAAPFAAAVSRGHPSAPAMLAELEWALERRLLEPRFQWFWMHLDGLEGWAAFRALRAALRRRGPFRAELGLVEDPRPGAVAHTAGLLASL